MMKVQRIGVWANNSSAYDAFIPLAFVEQIIAQISGRLGGGNSFVELFERWRDIWLP